jgi:hypothetical protein
MAELPKLVLSSSDRILSREIGEDGPGEGDRWMISSPIPGMRVINTWQIYHKIWLVLALAEDGHYNIFRSINLQKYTLVHEHESRIYGLYYIDDGHAIFCAEDGWWATTNAGVTWTELALTALLVGAMAVVQSGSSEWGLVTYGLDHKIYYAEYPDGDFEEVYDASAWSGKWYPAIAGGPVGFLAGAGNQLLRSENRENWYVIQTVDGIIKNIAISGQSSTPTFLITVEPPAGEADKLYLTQDMGDSIVANVNRIGLVSAAQAVTPTGSSEMQTTFAVLGKRAAGENSEYKLLGGG